MTIAVTREAVCLADDQFEPLALTLEFGAEATLADLADKLAKTGFLHFSSSHHTLIGRSMDKPLLRIGSRRDSRAVEYLLAAETRLADAVTNAAIDFRFERVPLLRPVLSDLDGRRPVWLALSDMFLDTDTALFREANTRQMAESPYSLDELDTILCEEVYPACLVQPHAGRGRVGRLRSRLAGAAHPLRRPAAPAVVAFLATLPDAGLDGSRAPARGVGGLAGGHCPAQAAGRSDFRSGRLTGDAPTMSANDTREPMATEILPDNKALRAVKSAVFTLVGVALLISAVGWAVSTRRFVARAATTPGVVIRLNAGGSHPEVRFTSAAGHVIEYPQGGMIWGYRVGDTVEVLYKPDNPTGSAVINRPGALWGLVAMDFLLGAGFVLLAQLAWWRPDWAG